MGRLHGMAARRSLLHGRNRRVVAVALRTGRRPREKKWRVVVREGSVSREVEDVKTAETQLRKYRAAAWGR